MNIPSVLQGVALDYTCPNCKGSGRTMTGRSIFSKAPCEEDCSDCRGVGFFPTEEGKALLRFVARHLYVLATPSNHCLFSYPNISPPRPPQPVIKSDIKPEPSAAIGFHPLD